MKHSTKNQIRGRFLWLTFAFIGFGLTFGLQSVYYNGTAI